MASNKYYLGDLITQRREKNPGGDLPIRGVSKEGLQPPKQIDADTSIYNLYYRNDFIYNPARMELGSIAFNDEYDKAICSSLYEVFYVHRTDLVIPEYLALFVKNPEFARYCNYIGNGSAREYCRFDNISGIPIHLPPISEQRKIVHDYQVMMDRIELLRKINENLEEQEDTIFREFYSDDSWDEGHFSDLVVGNIPGDWGSDRAEGNTNAQVTCIRGADIPGLSVGNTGDAPKRFILQKNYISKALPTNAMIIEISGGSPTQSTGRIALLTDILRNKLNQRVICSNFCKAVTVKENYLYFFYLAWRHLYKTNRLFDYENSTIGLKNFDYQSFVTQESIKIPSTDDGKRLNDLIEPIRKMIVFNGLEVERLMNLQVVVLPNLMK